VNQPPAEARWLTHAHREKGDASRGTLEVAARALDTVGHAGTGACLPKGRWLALTLALAWLTLDARPELGALPPGWPAAVSQWGRASVSGARSHCSTTSAPARPRCGRQAGGRASALAPS
jgi:hypothetical protein